MVPSEKKPVLGIVFYSCRRFTQAVHFDIFEQNAFAYRYEIFTKITLPSLANQTCKDFCVLVLHSSEMPPKYQAWFQDLQLKYSFLRVYYIDPKKSAALAIREIAPTYLDFSRGSALTFRLDNDDALPMDYVARHVPYARGAFSGHSLSIPKITTIERRGKDAFLLEERYSPSNAIGLAYVSQEDNFSCVTDLGNHRTVHRTTPMILLPGAGGLQTINGLNIKNKLHKNAAMPQTSRQAVTRLLNLYGPIDINCLDVEPWHRKLTKLGGKQLQKLNQRLEQIRAR